MLRLVSLNIEIDCHFGRFEPLIASVRPDVVLLQEAPEECLPDLSAKLGLPHIAFAAMTVARGRLSGRTYVMGQAVLSRHRFETVRTLVYGGRGDGQTPFDVGSVESRWQTSRHTVLAVDLTVDVACYRVLTTHFPWSAAGKADDHQRLALGSLLDLLDGLGGFVLAGDFNAPRGGEIFTRLAERFVDNIPAQYTTSLDGTLHRAGALPYMVDGLFTTAGFSAREVRLEAGVSDHMAIVATIVCGEGSS